jgi:hypothetical protein
MVKERNNAKMRGKGRKLNVRSIEMGKEICQSKQNESDPSKTPFKCAENKIKHHPQLISQPRSRVMRFRFKKITQTLGARGDINLYASPCSLRGVERVEVTGAFGV